MSASAALPKDSPILQAWERYKLTEEYENTKRWAVHAEHIDGSLWAVFLQAWLAGAGRERDLSLAHDRDSWQARALAAEARVAELEEVLRYCIEALERIPVDSPYASARDLMEARAALARAQGEGENP